MPSANDSPMIRYRKALAEGFVVDAGQEPAVAALEACHHALNAGNATRGVYLWGPVGRGKTWLMDQFYQSRTVPALRMHFHHFMRWLHQELFSLTGTPDPLAIFADRLASRYRVLCFDELFVSDIADAMLLGGVFQHLFSHNFVLLATSNQPPEQLYEDGFNREQFLPAIAAIQEHMDVVNLAGEQDHRLHKREARQRYWVKPGKDDGKLSQLFWELSRGTAPEPGYMMLNKRQLNFKGRAPGIIWCAYADLCEQPLSAQDYIALCDQAEHILLDELPCLSASPKHLQIARGTEDAVRQVQAGDRELPVLARQDDAVRRFIALVDECYDRSVALYIEAAVPLEELYTEGGLLFAFQRTLSRLRSMQYADYGVGRKREAPSDN